MIEAKIRPIEKQDNPAMAEVIRVVMTSFGACGPGFSIEDAEVDSMYEAYQNERAAYWVVELNGKVLGGAGVAQLEGGDPETCELKKMYFLEELRGKGFGKKLMELCIEKARSARFKNIYLETLDRMNQAQGLYERFGFKKIDAQLGNTGHSGCNTFYMLEL